MYLLHSNSIKWPYSFSLNAKDMNKLGMHTHIASSENKTFMVLSFTENGINEMINILNELKIREIKEIK